MNALRMAAVLAALAAPCAAGEGPRRPNIVFILADDLGWTDLGCQGSKYYETPSIDRLAAQGMRFLRYYNCQNCAPTRAALLSGQYAPRTGVYTVGSLERGVAEKRRMEVPRNETNLPLDRVTVAGALQAAGYATAIFGKWHLGGQGDFFPGRRGFDEAVVTMGRHFDFETQPKVEVPPGTYLADFLTDLSLRFIEKNRDRPFFLYLAHFGVHSPHQAKPELVARFQDRKPAGGHRDPTYAAMISSLDESVGRVMAKLDELKLAGDTVVIFSSDNGGVGGYETTEPGALRRGITDNAPLRGGKGTLYEGGLRDPFIVRWPGVAKAGAVCEEPAVHVDIFPTFLEISGAPRPAQPLDGVSLVPLFKDPKASLGGRAIFWHFPGYLESYVSKDGWRTTPAGAIHAGDLKLLEFFEDGRLELYNLREDIGERRNLAGEMPEKAKELRSRLAAWRKELDAAMPRPKAAPGGAADARGSP